MCEFYSKMFDADDDEDDNDDEDDDGGAGAGVEVTYLEVAALAVFGHIAQVVVVIQKRLPGRRGLF